MLDGFPRSYQNAKDLFYQEPKKDEGKVEGEGEGEPEADEGEDENQ